MLETADDFTTVEQEPRSRGVGDDDDGRSLEPTSSVAPVAPTTATTVVGRTAGEIPEGADCG
ncbi:MAG: hypothetical protein U5R31_03850 [Acidimicrobiia bacterium]|nr:hypothetical protein [Acidimicrobiia bacterium]